MTLTDINGLVILSDKEIFFDRFILSLSNVKDGTYILTLSNENELLQGQIIVKH
jgi:hypothetical protein